MKQQIPIPGQEALLPGHGLGTVESFDFDCPKPYIELKLYNSRLLKRYQPGEVQLITSFWDGDSY